MKIIIDTKYKLAAMYEQYKAKTGKDFYLNGKIADPLCAACWIDLAVEMAFTLGEDIRLGKSMLLLAEVRYA
jgi:hypothetical protein